MKRYPEYKESEVGWIGKIPSYWQTATIKHLTKNLDGKRIPLSGEVRAEQKRIYPYYGANGVIDYVENYIFEGEHILIGEDGAPFFDKTREVSLLASGKFWVNNHCHILENIGASEARFIVHCLNSVDYFEYITGSTRDKLTQADLNRIKIPIPTYQEQTQIAAFLDRKTGQIDELIRIKERRIELLQEQRTALINQAVTKGLDPNVEMKPSGVEWIGDICEHWEIKKLKHIVQGGLTNGLFKKKDQFGSGVKLINVTDMYQDDFLVKFEELGRVEAKPHEIETYAVEPGDIFFVRSSLKLEGVAASACITDVPEPTVFECHLVRLQPCPTQILFRYLINYLNSTHTRQRLITLANTVTMTTIAQPKLASIEVTLPPLSEQRIIVDFLDRKTKQIDELIAAEQRKIELLKEYRQSLISEAVTGKIDVRSEV